MARRRCVAIVPHVLSVSNNNMFARQAGSVWHGEPVGDRRVQVAAVLDEGLTGATRTSGRTPGY